MKKSFLIFGMICALSICLATTFQSCAKTSETAQSTDISATVTDNIMSRRSIRKYKDSAIGRDTLDAILQCGINAPNGKAMQAYEIRVINNPALLDSITKAVLTDMPELGERPGFKNIFVNAPCVIFIANDRSYDLSQVDCGLLGENIMLSAWSKGIGSCCLGSSIRWMKDCSSAERYLEQLNFSEGYELLYCIALGYPDETPAAKPRKTEMIKYIE